MLLAATDLGLGCSLVVGFNEEKIIDLLKIPEPAKPYAIIAIGHAAEPERKSAKYPLDHFVYFEKNNARPEPIETQNGRFVQGRLWISWSVRIPV